MTNLLPPDAGADLRRILLADAFTSSEHERRTEDEIMERAAEPWTASDDVELRAGIERARRRREALGPVHLERGRLRDVLRARAGGAATGEATVDLVAVRVDGNHHWFASTLVARHRRGRVVAVTNVPWRSGALASTSSDPTDGLVEAIDAQLRLVDHLQRPIRRGELPPSPTRLRRSQAAGFDIELGRPTPVVLDGVEVAVARYVSLLVEPAALVCRW